ncbi:MAG: hypothetical protein ACRDKZ_01915, partial [Actinomycetota bacterium]
AYQPDWSPDGSSIVHTRVRFDANGNGSSQLYLMDPDGGEVSLVPTGASTESDPTWSPDGRRIAFVTGRDGATEIYVMDSDGTGLVRVTNHPGDDFTPAWSPDGSRIAFASDRDGDSEIYVARTDGTEIVQLTNNASDDTNPDWVVHSSAPGPTPVASENSSVDEPVCPVAVRYEIAGTSESPADVRLVVEDNTPVLSALGGTVERVETNEGRGWAEVQVASDDVVLGYRFYLDSARGRLPTPGKQVNAGDVIGGAHELLDLKADAGDIRDRLERWGCRRGLLATEVLRARMPDGSLWEVRLAEPIEVIGSNHAIGGGDLEVDGEAVAGGGVITRRPDFSRPEGVGFDPPVLLEEFTLEDGRRAEHWDLAPSHENDTFAYALWIQGPGEHMYFSSGAPIDDAELVARSLRFRAHGPRIKSVWFDSPRVNVTALQAVFFLTDPAAPLRGPEVRINTLCTVGHEPGARCAEAELEVPIYTPGTERALRDATVGRA